MDKDPKIATFNFDFSDDPNNEESPYSGFVMRPKIGHYKLNMQAGIWRTNILNELWHDSDTPWTWELYGTSRTFDNKYKFFSLKDYSDSPIKYGKDKILFGIFRGKWIKEDVYPLFERERISINLNERGFFSDNDGVSVTGTSYLEKYKYAKKTLSKKYFMLWFLIGIKNRINVLFHRNRSPISFIDYLINKKS